MKAKAPTKKATFAAMLAEAEQKHKEEQAALEVKITDAQHALKEAILADHQPLKSWIDTTFGDMVSIEFNINGRPHLKKLADKFGALVAQKRKFNVTRARCRINDLLNNGGHEEIKRFYELPAVKKMLRKGLKTAGV